MKEILLYYAQCNKLINENLIQVVRENIAEPYDFALKGYYFKTLGAIFDHLFTTDMIWMQTFSTINSYGFALEKEVGEVPKYGAHVFQTFDEFKKQRTRLDNFILSFVSRVDQEFLTRTVTRKLGNGVVIEKNSLKAMVHFFNHQTHHRGQISSILDEMNIENNYSNMIFFDI